MGFRLPYIGIIRLVGEFVFVSIIGKVTTKVYLPVFSKLFFPIDTDFETCIQHFSDIAPRRTAPITEQLSEAGTSHQDTVSIVAEVIECDVHLIEE